MATKTLATLTGSLLLLMGTTACSSGNSGRDSRTSAPLASVTTSTPDPPAAVSKFCRLMTEWAQAERGLREVNKQTEPGRYLSLLEQTIRLFKEVPAASPPSITHDIGIIVSIPPDPTKVSEAQARDGAVARVDSYVAGSCDVRYSFKAVDFRPSS